VVRLEKIENEDSGALRARVKVDRQGIVKKK
jgi:hypothetical protein